MATGERYLYWRFVALGVATLAIWNAYIVSSGFFRWVLRGTPFESSFESVFSVVSNSVNLAALSYALYTQAAADHDRRIRRSLHATAAAFAAVSLVAALGIGGYAALATALLALCVASVAAAYIQCSVLGIAAPLPPSCAEAYMGGQAIAGTVASAAQLAVVYSGPTGESSSIAATATAIDGHLQVRTAAYFGVGAAFLALCVGAWRQLHVRLARTGDGQRLPGGHTATPAGALRSAMQEGSPSMLRARVAEHTPAAGDPGDPGDQTELDMAGPGGGYAPAPTGGPPPARTLPKWLASLGLQNAQPIYATYAEIRPFAAICGMAMAQTLAVFPPLTEAVVSSPQAALPVAHLTAWHFFVFNVADYAGRLSTQWLPGRSLRALWWAAHARWLLVPVLLLFPTAATLPLPSRTLALRSDPLFLAVVFALGWSNGWIATTALIHGPRHATNKELAGSILGLAMCIGLVVGAVASYPVLLAASMR
ncbi:hypothetical protein H4R18_001031 [Coemansia javaensis]|uniref:Rhodanese domain-containing protein n=1 Tax=Coemansia javaensis TaxID=2761396 RepID=A0A9W8LL93_9FUNG|nr:hypothetical protein H4R18_001031 [Coemansia javaensis]